MENQVNNPANDEFQGMAKGSPMEMILNNPGLQHLAENIIDNLKYKNLEICRGINQSSKQILDYQMDKPLFLLRKFERLSKKTKKTGSKLFKQRRILIKKNLSVHI